MIWQNSREILSPITRFLRLFHPRTPRFPCVWLSNTKVYYFLRNIYVIIKIFKSFTVEIFSQSYHFSLTLLLRLLSTISFPLIILPKFCRWFSYCENHLQNLSVAKKATPYHPLSNGFYCIFFVIYHRFCFFFWY